MLPHRLSDRLRLLRGLLPAAIALFGVIYQTGIARYVHHRYGESVHLGVEIFLYSAVYPVALWFTLGMVCRWVDEKEQAEAEVYRLNRELQQRVEERTRELREKADALASANQRLQELDELKSEFVSLVSHELRAPLTNVQGAVELMEGSCPAMTSTCKQMFGIVGEQIRRLARLVDDVLNVSRIESGGLSLACASVDLTEIAERAIHDIRVRRTGHVFRRAQRTDRPLVWADADKVYEVLANLFDNAAKYSPAGTTVVLEVRSDDGEAVASVSDNGPGIPLEKREQIFEKFHRLDSGDAKETYGYGLGLYVSRRLVEAMNGRIWVESVPGRGATFRFALPLATSSP